jgi:thioredoxin reductase (NADPH)
MTFFSTAERLEIGGVPFVVAGDKPTRREALRYYQRLAREFELDVRQYEAVRDVTPAGRGFRIRYAHERQGARTNTRRATSSSRPATSIRRTCSDIPGRGPAEGGARYREGHAYYDQDVVVVGGGNSAVDAALELHRWGARVTIVHFADALDPNVKPWVRPDIEARCARAPSQSRFGSPASWRSVRRAPSCARRHGRHRGDPERLGAGHDRLHAGRPLLRALGVEFDPVTGIPHHDPGTMETNVQGVFIAGVLSAGFNANKVFIENGRGHGDLIVRHMQGSWRAERRCSAAPPTPTEQAAPD